MIESLEEEKSEESEEDKRKQEAKQMHLETPKKIRLQRRTNKKPGGRLIQEISTRRLYIIHTHI